MIYKELSTPSGGQRSSGISTEQEFLRPCSESYLSNRAVTITNDGETVTREMSKGCPQGSVLGPLLWNITSDALLNKDFPDEVRPIAFADDVAFVIQGDTRRQVEELGNETMNILSEWETETKMNISTQKYKLVILKGNMNARPPVIKYRDLRIGKVEAATYLDVEIDKKLTFLPHIKRQGAKARTLFGKISCLLKVSFGASTISLNFLYKTVFLPVMTYAAKHGSTELITGKSQRTLKKLRSRFLSIQWEPTGLRHCKLCV